MIRLDYRSGSGELEPLFKPFGIQVVKCKLDFGDMDFVGNGPHGQCAVVVERKRIDDLIASIQSKRLSGHQLPGMAEQYDYCYLMVEGIWRPGKDGEIEVQQWGKWTRRGTHYRAIDSYLSTLELQAGVIYRRSGSDQETVFLIVDLYRYWTEKVWAEHKAHEAVYAPGEGHGRRISFIPRDVSLVEKVACQLPGLDSKARYAAKRFRTVRDLANASESDWAAMEWVDKSKKKHKLGLVGARKIMEALG